MYIRIPLLKLFVLLGYIYIYMCIYSICICYSHSSCSASHSAFASARLMALRRLVAGRALDLEQRKKLIGRCGSHPWQVLSSWARPLVVGLWLVWEGLLRRTVSVRVCSVADFYKLELEWSRAVFTHQAVHDELIPGIEQLIMRQIDH